MSNIHHKSKVYGWANCPTPIRESVNNILDNWQDVLGDNLVGFYLHGSLAMECFNPLVSDVDLLAVVQNKTTIEQKKAIINYILENHNRFPVKGLEMTIVLEEHVQNFIYPTPFELHFSNDWYQRYRDGEVDYSIQNTDEDLTAHFTIIKSRGICLYGKPVNELFPDIPRKFYARSLLYDARWIYERTEIDPLYTILNLCRILAFFRTEKVMSKKEGGEWALSNLPGELFSLISRALAVYSSGNEDVLLDANTLKSFVGYAKTELSMLTDSML